MSIFNKFSVFDLVIIGMMAALGIATKPVVVPLIHMITAPLFIPGGSVAGGIYMMWIVLGAGLVNRRGAGTLIALVQAILVISLGVYGTHGMVSLLTYTIPGIAVDMSFLIIDFKRSYSFMGFFVAGISANLCGAFLSNMVFFQLPLLPLILSLSSGALSGGVGGIMAYVLMERVKKLNLPGISF